MTVSYHLVRFPRLLQSTHSDYLLHSIFSLADFHHYRASNLVSLMRLEYLQDNPGVCPSLLLLELDYTRPSLDYPFGFRFRSWRDLLDEKEKSDHALEHLMGHHRRSMVENMTNFVVRTTLVPDISILRFASSPKEYYIVECMSAILSITTVHRWI